MQISTSLRAQIGEHLRLSDLILRTATAVWLQNNEQNNATTATCEMRFGSFPNYIFKILAVEMTSIMITVRKREEFDECRDAFWLNALIFRSSSWDNTHMLQPTSQPAGTSIPCLSQHTAELLRPGSALNTADKLTGNNNAAPEWLTANNENTQQLGFGRACVYLGVHWQWHIEPGGLSSIPIWYAPFPSNASFVAWHQCTYTLYYNSTTITQNLQVDVRMWLAYMKYK